MFQGQEPAGQVPRGGAKMESGHTFLRFFFGTLPLYTVDKHTRQLTFLSDYYINDYFFVSKSYLEYLFKDIIQSSVYFDYPPTLCNGCSRDSDVLSRVWMIVWSCIWLCTGSWKYWNIKLKKKHYYLEVNLAWLNLSYFEI